MIKKTILYPATLVVLVLHEATKDLSPTMPAVEAKPKSKDGTNTTLALSGERQ
jgi:hypothetical protein